MCDGLSAKAIRGNDGSSGKRLGDLFRTREKNLALAAELYGRAAELANSALGSGSREERQELLGLVLDRAECLAELRNDEEAEAAAVGASKTEGCRPWDLRVMAPHTKHPTHPNHPTHPTHLTHPTHPTNKRTSSSPPVT